MNINVTNVEGDIYRLDINGKPMTYVGSDDPILFKGDDLAWTAAFEVWEFGLDWVRETHTPPAY